MTTSDSEVPRPVLSDADRARLRPTVDAEAFERFLAAIPEEVRPGVKRAAVLHFSRAVTMADIRDFLSAAGNDDAAAAVDRAIVADAAPGAPAPAAERPFSMEPPDSPPLRALWDAIEPPPPG